jgi:UDP-hydrolysing UDP-N-acetyl-D-glucosamine 2-epimerase
MKFFNKKKKICTILVDRANFGRLYPVMEELKKSKNIDQKILISGSMVLNRFGNSVNSVKNKKFKIDAELFMELEGSNNFTMTKSIGYGVLEFTNELKKIKPDITLIIGDRYEALAAAIASTYLNIPVAHVQGGEISGSLDEITRHAITKLSYLHFPSTKKAAKNIISMGENPNNVYLTGCPSGDYIKKIKVKKNIINFNKIGIGYNVDLKKKFLLIIYHPNTSNLSKERENIQNLISAIHHFDMPTIWLWPNIDAGSDIISKELRIFRELYKDNKFKFIKNLEIEDFQILLNLCECAIGNSSSFVRDSSFTGTPVLLVGDRQKQRERSNNVTEININKKLIIKSLKKIFSQKTKFKKSKLYGSGNASIKIRKILENLKKLDEKKFYQNKKT